MADNNIIFEQLIMLKEKINEQVNNLKGNFGNEKDNGYNDFLISIINSYYIVFLELGRKYYNDKSLNLVTLEKKIDGDKKAASIRYGDCELKRYDFSKN